MIHFAHKECYRALKKLQSLPGRLVEAGAEYEDLVGLHSNLMVDFAQHGEVVGDRLEAVDVVDDFGDGSGHPSDVLVKAGGGAEAAAPLLVQVFDGGVFKVKELLLDVVVLLEQEMKRIQQHLVHHRLEVLPTFLQEVIEY